MLGFTTGWTRRSTDLRNEPFGAATTHAETEVEVGSKRLCNVNERRLRRALNRVPTDRLIVCARHESNARQPSRLQASASRRIDPDQIQCIARVPPFFVVLRAEETQP